VTRAVPLLGQRIHGRYGIADRHQHYNRRSI
jgi:hypothetical protein